MPLIGTSSYPGTLRQFLYHWSLVNAELPDPMGLILREGSLPQAEGLAAQLDARIDGVRGAVQELVVARAELQMKRTEIRGVLEQFGLMVRAYWAGTPWADLVPLLPPVEAALDKFLRPCRDAFRLWTLLEAEPAPTGAPVPLRLGAGADYTRADFANVVKEVRLLGMALEETEFAVDVARARRDAVVKQVRALLMSYFRTVPGRLPADSPLLGVLPRLWPLPGKTPEPVVAQGVWDSGAQVARLTWQASTDKELDHYEARVCEGPEYDKKEESVAGRVPAGELTVLETAAFLSLAGAVASFRLYVVLKTDNERGSQTVVVRRPAGQDMMKPE